ncbi:MAG: AMP-binding protein [Myxococcota bacterium]|nr:AMP-binding protein [Myxococcota bacterium]
MTPQEEVRAQLTGPGGPFEIVLEDVRGVTLPVFKERLRSLRDLLAQSAAHGDKELMVYEGRRVSYQENIDRIASLARVFAEQYGIRSGDRVAILAANRPEFLEAFWATVSLGAIAVAFNGWWVAEEINYAIGDSEPRLLVADRKRLARLEGRDPGIPVLEMEADFPKLCGAHPGAELPTVAIDEDDPCVILYTSGTTGKPKGALTSHRSILGFVQCYSLTGLEGVVLAARQLAESGAEAPPPPPSPCTLATVPLFHLSGLYAASIMMLAVGGKTVFMEGRFDPEKVLQLIQDEKITSWSALGNTGQRVVAHPTLKNYDVSSIRNIGFGGAPTSPALMEALREAFPSAARAQGMGYGLSESAGIGTVIGGEDFVERPTSAGRAVPTHEVQVRSAANEPLPDGVDGEIHIRSADLMLGYWGRPDATEETLKPGGWLATGDIGRLEDGWLYINSRARDMILRGAENIYPVEIEHRLDSHPTIGESAVVGVDHPELGQEVKAFVVPAPGHSIDTDELARFTGEALAGFKVPAHWEIMTEPLPRNAAGKVLKNVLTGDAENTQIDE